MKITEMQTISQEILIDFIKAMPDVPFTEDDIIIEFAPKSKLVERFKALCEICCPRRILNKSQEQELANVISGNAIVGEKKSAVIIRIDYKIPEQFLRTVMFHEFMHIYCAKTEVNGEHFIDIYGNGLTIDDDDIVDAGYQLWSEFIAQYYALFHTEKNRPPFDMAQEQIFDYLCDVVGGNKAAKNCLSQTCAHLMNCSDFDEVLKRIKNDSKFLFLDNMPYGADSRRMFLKILSVLQGQLDKDKPCKINIGFMVEIGELYFSFLTFNSMFLANA